MTAHQRGSGTEEPEQRKGPGVIYGMEEADHQVSGPMSRGTSGGAKVGPGENRDTEEELHGMGTNGKVGTGNILELGRRTGVM